MVVGVTGQRNIASLRKTRDGTVAFIIETDKTDNIITYATKYRKKLQLEEDVEVEITSYEEERIYVIKRMIAQLSNETLRNSCRRSSAHNDKLRRMNNDSKKQ